MVVYPKKQFLQSLGSAAGQSLIETITAVGILSIGIVGGLSLAIYALTSANYSINQIVATGLAREGIEIVRNMRDSNWLNDTLVDCSSAMGTGQQCYDNWDTKVFDIHGTVGGQKQRVSFDPGGNSWQIQNGNGGGALKLYPGPNGTYVHAPPNGAYKYYRQILLSSDIAAPFSNFNYRLIVDATVWWVGKNCPDVSNPGNTTCKVLVEDYLTNWKNF